MTKKIIYTTVALILLPVLLGLRVLFYFLHLAYKLALKVIMAPITLIGYGLRPIDRLLNNIYHAYQERCFRNAVNDMICSNDVLGYTYRQTVFHELD